MPAPSQDARPFAVTSPLGPDVLLLLRMSGSETLGRLFTYELELLSTDHEIAMADVLGQHLTVRANIRNEGERFFDGIVSRFSYVGNYGQYARYQATLRPWLWFLTRTADCRIFQGDTTVDIMKKIFGEYGFSDLDLARIATPPVREYCTQYRESAFAFLSRLAEDDGIYYYFTHEEGKHKLVLADGASCHDTVPGYEEIPCSPEGSPDSPDADRFLQWYVTQELQTGVYAHTDYDFKKPKTKLETKGVIARDHTKADLEWFDFPGNYLESGPGETIAKTRIEEHQAGYEFGHGSGTVRGLGAGSLFALTEHPRADLNKTYLVVSAQFELSNPEYETGMGKGTAEPAFTCHITAIDEQTQYRPPRLTPRPIVEGPQTATVTGSGSDVWTDEYGRIKVHFHWDRKGPESETSSCWVRVSQNWAGKNWGGMFLPHIGQEVIVSFLEGSPDSPIVTGRVYNQDNMPPLDLPAAKLKSIIRDNYGNQIIFDATPGDEHIQIYSPHHSSRLEIGRSHRWVVDGETHQWVQKDSYEGTVGLHAAAFLGGKIAVTVGGSADVMAGFKFGVTLGGKWEVGVGPSMSHYWGTKYEYAKGTKVTAAAQKELKYAKKDFEQYSDENIILDCLKKLTLNAGPKDNAVFNMDENAIVLDFGADTTPAKKTNSDKAMTGAIFAMTGKMIATAGTAVGVTMATMKGSQLFESSSDKVSLDESKDRLKDLFVDGGFTGDLGVIAGSVAAGAIVSGIASRYMNSVVAAAEKKGKSAQDKTYARIKLYNDGIRLQTFPGGDPEGEPPAAEIFCAKTGEIEIFSEKERIHLFSKKEIIITAKENLSIKSDADVSIEGKNIKLKATSKITANPAVENC